MSRNGLYTVIAILVIAVVGVVGYMMYQQSQQPKLAITVDKGGIQVKAMADEFSETPVVEALLRELGQQGQGGAPGNDRRRLTAYPIKGTIDVLALAEAVENALRGVTSDDDGKTSAELNAANDG